MDPISILGVVAGVLGGTLLGGLLGAVGYYEYKLHKPIDWSKEPVVPWS